MRLISTLFSIVLSILSVSAGQWHTDTLGGDFQSKYFDQGHDYSGPVRSTIIRLVPKHPTDIAVCYIHGFNDYFFQSEMAQQFVDHRYAFFAIDLRKYGRSLMLGQKRCQVRNFNEYFNDIDSALTEIRSEGYERIVMMGHSTGGLVAAYYIARQQPADVDALLLNSPFLDWNLGKMECFVGAVSAVGRLFPNIAISSGKGTAYGESLHKDYHGEWNFNTQWKSITPTKVDLGWINAVNSAQNYLKHHPGRIHIPILLMYSDKSVSEENWSPDVDSADAVLDVKDIRAYGNELGPDVTSIMVRGGRHDLVLSKEDVRRPLYNYIFHWLDREGFIP